MSLDNERFFVEYSDGSGSHRPFKLYYNINEYEISKFWKKCILENFLGENNVSGSTGLDKLFMNKGFYNTWESEYSRNLEILCTELNYAISLVNEHMVPEGYDFIDLEFTLEKLKDPEVYRDIMNRIHHHFEVLIGQSWNYSDWYLNHTNEISRWAIGQLNTCCHAIEAGVEAINGSPNAHSGISFSGGIKFGQTENGTYDKNVYYLEEKHYADYKQIHTEWGSITPYYSQLGKTPREAFHDGDNYIGDENITPPMIMTGECNLNFFSYHAPGSNRPLNDNASEQQFIDWLTEMGRDYNDPLLAIGYCEIGSVATEIYPESWLELHDIILQYDNVTEIGFVDENLDVIVSQRYDYTWQEQYAEHRRLLGINE